MEAPNKLDIYFQAIPNLSFKSVNTLDYRLKMVNYFLCTEDKGEHCKWTTVVAKSGRSLHR